MRDHLECTVGTPPPAPQEWEDFELCALVGCLPHDLDELEEATYQQWLGFLRVQRVTGRLKSLQEKFYG